MTLSGDLCERVGADGAAAVFLQVAARRKRMLCWRDSDTCIGARTSGRSGGITWSEGTVTWAEGTPPMLARRPKRAQGRAESLRPPTPPTQLTWTQSSWIRQAVKRAWARPPLRPDCPPSWATGWREGTQV